MIKDLINLLLDVLIEPNHQDGRLESSLKLPVPLVRGVEISHQRDQEIPSNATARNYYYYYQPLIRDKKSIFGEAGNPLIEGTVHHLNELFTNWSFATQSHFL